MSEHLWEWGYNRGVKIEVDGIVWYDLPTAYASDAGCTQNFEHFLANGPWDRDVPPEILEKLTAAVRARAQVPRPASGASTHKTPTSPAVKSTNKRKTPRRSQSDGQ